MDYDFLTYDTLGKYHCHECGFKRPQLNSRVNQIYDIQQSTLDFNLDGFNLRLPYGGIYNIYNALAAYQVMQHFDISEKTVKISLQTPLEVAGRQEVVTINSKTVHLNLIKNQVGFEQSLQLVQQESKPFTLVVVINNQPADGEDVSWLNHVNYELLNLPQIKVIYTGGMKNEVIHDLIKSTHLNKPIESIDSLNEIESIVSSAPTDVIHIIASYTAMTPIRNILIS